MKILVHLDNNTSENSSSLQVFDYYYAYNQSRNKHNNYRADCEIKIGKNMSVEAGAINIGFYHMPKDPVNSDKFDFLIVDGGQHHLEVCTPEMYRAFVELENCYFLTAALVVDGYPGADKLLPFPFTQITRDFLTRPFYPQYYDRGNQKIENSRQNMIYINGQNRPQRQYMMDLLESTVGTAMTIRQNNYTTASKLNDSFFETRQDTQFREFVNNYCANQDNVDQETQGYYDRSIQIGIDQKFGRSPPGFFVIDEYLAYHCVIFPETTWLNDEVWITEKLLKCAITKSIPWPIAGSNTDVLYNQLGFKTAWNLLPEQLQSYNYEKDHIARYRMCAEAINWMAQHPEILVSAQAQDLVEHNYNYFFSNTIEALGPIKLDQILRKYSK